MRLTRTSAPAGLPVSLDTVKLHCRVDSDDEDVLITSLIGAAVDYLDGPSGILGRAILQQTWQLERDSWFDTLALPLEPIDSVVLTYTDAAGDSQTVAAENYELVRQPSQRTRIVLKDSFTRPALNTSASYPVQIAMVAGYADADAVPEAIKVAIQLMVGHWYLNREAVALGSIATEIPMGASALLARYRVLL